MFGLIKSLTDLTVDVIEIATGDIGLLENNQLTIIDRKAAFLKVKGYKVSSNYVEKIILDSEMIQEVHVLAENDTLIANVIPLSNYDKNKLIHFLQRNLPYYFMPDRIEEVKRMKRTNTGKISRH